MQLKLALEINGKCLVATYQDTKTAAQSTSARGKNRGRFGNAERNKQTKSGLCTAQHSTAVVRSVKTRPTYWVRFSLIFVSRFCVPDKGPPLTAVHNRQPKISSMPSEVLPVYYRSIVECMTKGNQQ